MKHTLKHLGLGLCLSLLASVGMAQSTMAPAGLYQALGEQAGISKLTDDFVNRLVKDPRIGGQFKNTNLPNLKKSLSDQFCNLSGGPCNYKGPDMKTVHSQMDINKANFNALVEVLQEAMDSQGIAFSQQNRLLALLAPMHKDIITIK